MSSVSHSQSVSLMGGRLPEVVHKIIYALWYGIHMCFCTGLTTPWGSRLPRTSLVALKSNWVADSDVWLRGCVCACSVVCLCMCLDS